MKAKRKSSSIAKTGSAPGTLAIVVREEIIRAMRLHTLFGDPTLRASRRLGVDRATLSRYLKRLQIKKAEWCQPLYLQPLILKNAA